MAIVMPFRGIRYSVDEVGDAGQVVSPPYDVIDSGMQDTLHAAHPCNVVRIIQGRMEQGDRPGAGRYTRAADHLRAWLDQGTLVRDAEPGLYLYAQSFDAPPPIGPARKMRLGIVALVSSEAFDQGDIYPHEHTMPGPKADRLELMRHTGAAFGQIFSLYSDPERQIQSVVEPELQRPPEFVFTDGQGVRHQLWRVTDRAIAGEASARLGRSQLFIADGHHRYETAVVYREERSAVDDGDWRDKPYGYRMHTLVNMDDADGMAIYPIHRVVTGLGAGGVANLASRLGELFDIETADMPAHEDISAELVRRSADGRPALGFVRATGDGISYLSLKSGVDMAALDPGGHTDAWRGLASGLLQLVLGRLLALDEDDLTRGEKVRFVRSESEVVRLVANSDEAAGFFLGPVEMSQLRDVVLAGERMPPKSTYFDPKVYTGLVMQDMNSF